MKPNELMIDNWVLKDINHFEEEPMYARLDYRPYQIKNGSDIDLALETNCIGDDSVYQPIPLTTEILENSGFEKCWDEDIMLMVFDSIQIEVGDNYKRYQHEGMYLRGIKHCLHYVHELQHALKLCGIGKEIIV